MADGVWDRVKRALRREKREIDDAIADATRHGNAVLDAKERELAATPEERLAIEEQRAAEVDAEFDALRRRLEGS
jgi:hypothetical protein